MTTRQTRKRPNNIYNASTECDVYKVSHRQMANPGTTRVYSNMTARGSRIPGLDKVVFFGLQAFIKKILEDHWGDWFVQDEEAAIANYARRMNAVLATNNVHVDHLRALHRVGYLPLEICALPEGTEVPTRVPLYTIENTVDEFYWLTNYIESILSAETWLPTTSVTQAVHMRRMLDAWADKTSDSPVAVNFQGHDFSFRGMSSLDSASASGAGHLLAFAGTDSLTALDWIDAYYGRDEANQGNDFIGGSVPATEHSVMCTRGPIGEIEMFHYLLEQFPTGFLSIVSDTYDYWNNLTVSLPAMKDKIMARDGRIVIRPDSGDPVKIVCGDPEAPADSPEFKGSIGLLWETFGGVVNSKGFMELDSHIGLIYGDSINFARAQEISERLAAKGFASTNVVFGVGSYTYQYVTRDTFETAMKATWAMVEGEGRDLFKSPKTDKGIKVSAKGRLAVQRDEDGELYLIQQATPAQEAESLLKPVWRDGQFITEQNWDEIVARVGLRSI